MKEFPARSLAKLKGVNSALVLLMQTALQDSPFDFIITEGVRSLETQTILFNTGKSRTMNSRHLNGRAVDIAVLVDGKVTWDFKYYKEVAAHIKMVAQKLNISITWGGDWKSFLDGPHFELRG
jgi:peptidoglycan L-alanyl-D-glutamate endopeptidase CwlK